MNDYYPENDYRDFLQHHGILGQRWGVRRYQNADGSLTSKGKQHYSNKERKAEKKEEKRLNKSLYRDTSQLAFQEFRKNNYERDVILRKQKMDDSIRNYLDDDNRKHEKRNYKRVEKAKAKYEKAFKEYEKVKLENTNARKEYTDKLAKKLDFDKYDVSMIPMEHWVGDWTVRMDTPQVRRKLS